MKVFKIFLFVSVFSILLCSPVLATSPSQTIQNTLDKVQVILDNAKDSGCTDKQIQRIWRLISPLIDMRSVAKRCLARHWKKISEAERKEFIDLFTHLIKYNYLTRLKNSKGKVTITILSEKVKKNRAIVKTEVQRGIKQPITLTYRMWRNNGRWLIYDLVIEGISLVNNYRKQFHSICVSKGFDKLLEMLREKKSNLKI